MSSSASNQDISLLVSSYPAHQTRYRSFTLCLLSILESSMSNSLYFSSSSTLTGGGGISTHLGMSDGVCNSSIDTWNTRCTACMESSKWSVNNYLFTYAIISKRPKNFSASLDEGLVVQKNLALMNIQSPTLKSRGGVHHASAGPWYQHCVAVM